MSGTHILSTTISLDASSSTSGVATVTVTRSSHIVGAAIIIGFIIILLCIVLILVKVRTAVKLRGIDVEVLTRLHRPVLTDRRVPIPSSSPSCSISRGQDDGARSLSRTLTAARGAELKAASGGETRSMLTSGRGRG